jgi:hypothetical protein
MGTALKAERAERLGVRFLSSPPNLQSVIGDPVCPVSKAQGRGVHVEEAGRISPTLQVVDNPWAAMYTVFIRYRVRMVRASADNRVVDGSIPSDSTKQWDTGLVGQGGSLQNCPKWVRFPSYPPNNVLGGGSRSRVYET